MCRFYTVSTHSAASASAAPSLFDGDLLSAGSMNGVIDRAMNGAGVLDRAMNGAGVLDRAVNGAVAATGSSGAATNGHRRQSLSEGQSKKKKNLIVC